jgi:hypothetical protein
MQQCYLPFLLEKYKTYSNDADASLDEILGEERLKSAVQFKTDL